MVVYVSESLNSKKNGGSSLSGLDFLQLLRIQVKDLVVVSNDGLSTPHATEFFGQKLLSIESDIVLMKKIKYGKLTPREVLRRIYYGLLNWNKRKQMDVASAKDTVFFVNSWSSIILNKQIIGFDESKKACIVRGNPESFIYQGDTEDPEENIRIAAEYLNQFQHLIFVSSIGLDAWKPYLQPGIKSHYLPNSIDEIEVNAIKQKAVNILQNDYPQVINLVAVGSLQTRKGQDMLIPVAKVLKEKGYNIKIHLVGNISVRWGGKEIVNDIKNSNVSDCFVIHGHCENALDFVYSADICLFPTRAEAFPRTIAEYMALQKPIVTTNASGIPEMITHGVNGMMMDVDDHEAFANHIITLIENEDMAKTIAKNANTVYYEKFSKNCQINNAKKIIEEIAN